jgi:hypothetical protein
MTRRVRCYLFGAAAVGALGALAGCGHFMLAEREAWRHEAEAECISSGAVREGTGKVRISPIEGPGVCGIDFPLKVASLGSDAPLSFGEEPRPPGAIPGAGNMPPRWPTEPRPQTPIARDDLPPPAPRYGQPLSLDPARSAPRAPEPYDFRRPYDAQRAPSLGAGREVARSEWGQPPGPATVNPPATLACPLVSALDRWIDEAVQPAALKWLGAPVIEIKQISAYSCRGMNGDPNATISEHAFGNAIDIAAFTLADGRRVEVEHGWHGAPEEQAFLHEVQASACDQFNTVLAPGSNVYHYNHIHVDLMRRRSGRRACQPAPVSGAEMAARLGIPISARRDLSITGALPRAASPAKQAPKPMHASSFASRKSERDLPLAVPGADGVD